MKKIFRLFVILSLVLIFPVNAYNKTGARLEDNSGYKNICTRNDSNNYGVEKKWSMTDSKKKYASKTPCVDAKDKVYDFSDILTDDEENQIKKLIEEYSRKYNMDIIFVSYNLPYTNDKANDDFLADFYDYNSFGMDYSKYNGLAIFRNTYADDPYVRIMTFGEAQLYLYDTRFDTLMPGIKPYFSRNDYVGAFEYIIDYYGKCVKNGKLQGYRIGSNGQLQKVIPFDVSNILKYALFVGAVLAVIGGN